VERETIDWLPRAARKRVSLTGLAKLADERSVRVLVSDLSYQGCHVWSDHDFAAGEALTLYLPGYGEVLGQIRWQSEGRAGVRFLIGASAVDERRARLGV
jgi:PilZ domain